MQTAHHPASRYLIEHAPLFYLAFDRDAVVRETNGFTSNLLGPEVCGRSFNKIFVDPQGCLDLATLAGAPDPIRRLEVSARTGLPQTVECGFYPAGDFILAIGHVDISEMLLLQRQFLQLNNELNVATRQLQKANAQLQNLNDLKNRFVGFAAHDLRKPLGVILTYTDFLIAEARDRLTPEHCGFLDVIRARTRAMAQLIDELLNLAIIESGGNEPNLQLTELGQIFQTASMSVRGSAEAKSVQIIVTLDPSLAPLPLDPLKIEQTVVNLLSNAVEHTRSGTAVRLAARHEPNHVIVSVSDQGPGVPPAMLDRLFQPFARWQGQKTPGHTSHGLGLAIAKRMVDAHQGRIWLEANSNQGATFSFSLPIHRGSL